METRQMEGEVHRRADVSGWKTGGKRVQEFFLEISLWETTSTNQHWKLWDLTDALRSLSPGCCDLLTGNFSCKKKFLRFFLLLLAYISPWSHHQILLHLPPLLSLSIAFKLHINFECQKHANFLYTAWIFNTSSTTSSIIFLACKFFVYSLDL